MPAIASSGGRKLLGRVAGAAWFVLPLLALAAAIWEAMVRGFDVNPRVFPGDRAGRRGRRRVDRATAR